MPAAKFGGAKTGWLAERYSSTSGRDVRFLTIEGGGILFVRVDLDKDFEAESVKRAMADALYKFATQLLVEARSLEPYANRPCLTRGGQPAKHTAQDGYRAEDPEKCPQFKLTGV